DFSSACPFFDPQRHSPRRCNGSFPGCPIPNHGASMDLCSVNTFCSISVHREFCELSRHTQDSLAGPGIRIDWSRTNANHPILRLPIKYDSVQALSRQDTFSSFRIEKVLLT